MAFSVSPAVSIREVDASATIPPVATTSGGIAGVFKWGPVNERTLVTSETNLVSRFGKPTDFNYETFFSAADFLAYSNALHVVRVEDGANTAGASDNTFDAKYPGDLGNSIEVSVVTGSDSYSEALIGAGDVTDSITFGSTSITLSHTPSMDLIAGDTFRVGNTSIGFQDLEVTAITETPIDGNTSSYSITTENRYALVADSFTAMSGEKRWGHAASVSGAPKANSFHVVVVDTTGEFTGEADTVMEVYENISTLSTAKLADGTSNYYKDVIANKSAFVAVGSSDVSTAADTVTYITMTGGLDGNGERTDTIVPFATVAQGYDYFRNAEEVEVSLLIQGKAFGGQNETGIANYIIDNVCEVRKDCMIFASPSYADSVSPSTDTDKLTAIKAFAGSINASSYAFVDSGYKYHYDKYNDKYRWTPLNGDIAGLSARVQPWESPAGYKRGVVKNVTKLAYNPSLAHRDELYGAGVNPVIKQTGHGTVLFGDITSLGIESSAFNHINVRRLFIAVEKAIATSAKYFLFDLNDEFTQNRFKNLVEPYLRDIQGKRGITNFRVIADSSINTPDVVDASTFKGNIYITPAKSINHINLTFVATRTGVEFDEIVGQQL